MTRSIIQNIKVITMCKEADTRLSDNEISLTLTDELRDNCGIMSPSTEANDIKKANEKILQYIYSLRGKQRTVTPAEISKELGFSQDFIETILIANGFETD